MTRPFRPTARCQTGCQPFAGRFARGGLIWIAVAVAFAWLPGGTQAAEEEITNSLGMKLRLLPAGRFEMGERDLGPGFYHDHSDFNTEDESPVHPVVLTKPFFLAATEVTVGQFRRFVDETGYRTSAEQNERGAVGWDPAPPADNPRYLSTFRDRGGFLWTNPGFPQQDDHPVVGVSFVDAQAFCRWLSDKERAVYRLPTEAEWEYAARAGTTTYFSFGDVYRGAIHRHANIGNVELEKAFADRVRRQWLVDVERDPPDQHVFTAPAASYQANPWGLFDLYGNVWEWCDDRYLDTAYAPFDRGGYEQLRKRAIDPLNLDKQGDEGDWRVIRGGSWFNAPIQCRSGVRGYFEAGDAACYVGFRVVREADAHLVAAALQAFQRSEEARAALQRLADLLRERRDGRVSVELNHQQRPLNDEFFAALHQLDEPVDLYLHGRLTSSQLAEIGKTRRLAGLVVSGLDDSLTDAEFAMLADHPELELLEITGAANLSDGLLTHLQELQRLELLQLHGGGISDQGLRSLPSLEKLKTLHLRGTSSRGLALDRLQNAPLEEFSCDRLSDEGAELLARISTIRVLSISGSPITGRGLSAIARLPLLERLDLSGCSALTDADFAVLGGAYYLNSLQIDQTAASDRAAEGLARLNNLRELRIGGPELTDEGVRKLCEIVSLRNLTIAADAGRLSDAAFVDLWRLVNLDSFGVAAPRISGDGLASLGELPRLEWLSLEGAAIGDAALKHAAGSESLQRLSVGSWRTGGPAALTDEGVLHLAGSRSLKQFDMIRRATNVTDQALSELRQRCPQLTVKVH